MTTLEPGDIVLCAVDRIVGTVVFVTIGETGEEGNIVVSEIAPGRIRNLRDYVVPKKKIVCKVLRISGNTIDLSLRRVTLKEQKEILQRNTQEKSYASILKTILGEEESKKIIEEIRKTDSLYNFIQESKENPVKLEKLTSKKDAEKIITILNSQKQKKAVIKKEINLKSSFSDGIIRIKQVLGNIKDADIKYLSAGKYTISVEDINLKQASAKLKQILEEIEKQSKKLNMEFAIKEK